MGRRKPQYLQDSDSDSDISKRDSDGYNSQEDGDSRTERALFERNARKRRRTGGKESAWEGIFGEDDDDGPAYQARNDRRGPKSNAAFKSVAFFLSDHRIMLIELFCLRRAPNFVNPSASTATENPDEEPERRDKEESFEESDSESGEDSEEEERRNRPPVERDLSDDEGEASRPVGMGIGARQGGIGSGRAGINAGIGARGSGGIGARNAASTNTGRLSTFAASTSSTFTQSSAPPASTADETRESAPSTAGSNTPLDMQSGLGTANRARLEQAEEEMLYPKDDEHAYPQGFGKQAGRGGLGSSRSGSRASASGGDGGGGGIGSKRPKTFTVPEPTSRSGTPTPRPEVTQKDLRHLNSIANTFGARMLAKFGWEAGKGLGADESGKAVPIEANVGLQRGQGIGKGVRTEQSRRDAKARGEFFSSDEEEQRKKRKAKSRATNGVPSQDNTKGESASWKKQRKVKVKVEHKTYEQLISEAGEEGMPVDSGVGLVIDARGGEVSST